MSAVRKRGKQKKDSRALGRSAVAPTLEGAAGDIVRSSYYGTRQARTVQYQGITRHSCVQTTSRRRVEPLVTVVWEEVWNMIPGFYRYHTATSLAPGLIISQDGMWLSASFTPGFGGGMVYRTIGFVNIIVTFTHTIRYTMVSGAPPTGCVPYGMQCWRSGSSLVSIR
ncbi:unnamed protein product [Tuber aestivum]|uniref:Uncharacterized protein n=1 Tax=Tuber aestivum TaxID=59557 RepID=A0A292PSS9_9PEZI|nr:unnamed protein product [Tuber aestivum]